jgi:glycosyltransferase involved in cell wall biosynthesis
VEAAAIARAARILCSTEAARRESPAQSDPRARVLGYAARLDLEADPGVLDSLALSPRGYVLVLGPIAPELHVLEILRADARRSAGRSLLVVGDLERAGAYGSACRRAAGARARFLGPVTDAGVLHSLRAGSAAVVHGASRGAGIPALLETLASGAPVIARENPYHREVLGEDALYFRDEESLSAALARAEERSGDERDAAARAGRRRVALRHSWERVAEAYAGMLGVPAAPGSVEPPSRDASPAAAAARALSTPSRR